MALRRQSGPSALTLPAGTSFDHPLLNYEASVCGSHAEETLAFKSLLKKRTFVFSVEKWSKYWNLALNSVRLSALQLQPTTLDEDALPHATQKNNVFTKSNTSDLKRVSVASVL